MQNSPSFLVFFQALPALFRATLQKFRVDNCLVRAAALAYATVLSLVPFLAVAFSISKGLGFQNSAFMHTLLLQLTAGRQDLVHSIIGYIDNTKVSTLGIIGTGLLFITVLSLLSSVENAFNTIWNISRQRTLWRKFSDYLSITLVCPLFLLMAISMSASLESSSVAALLESLPFFSVVLKLIPLFASCAALFFLYFFIPNTSVHIFPAITGAVCAGILWHSTQMFYVQYLADSINYNAIYGSFAQVPLFLLWMFISWVIVLLGAQINCIVQKKITTVAVHVPGGGAYSFADRQVLAVRALTLLTSKFLEKKGNLSAQTLAQTLHIPVLLLHDILLPLESAGVLIRMDKEGRQEYIINRPPETVRVHSILCALAQYADTTEEHRQDTPPDPFFTELFADLDQAQKQAPANLTLTQCAARHPAVTHNKTTSDPQKTAPKPSASQEQDPESTITKKTADDTAQL